MSLYQPYGLLDSKAIRRCSNPPDSRIIFHEGSSPAGKREPSRRASPLHRECQGNQSLPFTWGHRFQVSRPGRENPALLQSGLAPPPGMHQHLRSHCGRVHIHTPIFEEEKTLGSALSPRREGNRSSEHGEGHAKIPTALSPPGYGPLVRRVLFYLLAWKALALPDAKPRWKPGIGT